jgi:hypothetical protein
MENHAPFFSLIRKIYRTGKKFKNPFHFSVAQHQYRRRPHLITPSYRRRSRVAKQKNVVTISTRLHGVVAVPTRYCVAVVIVLPNMRLSCCHRCMSFYFSCIRYGCQLDCLCPISCSTHTNSNCLLIY